MTIYPYVYRLDHPVTGEFYIGYRGANKVPALEDLGTKYFTSSKVVKPRFHEFQYWIIAEFFDHDAAYDFEQALIFDAWGQTGLLNKHHHYGKGAWNATGRKASDETRRKLSDAMKNMSDETRRKMSEARKNRPPISDETRRKMSAGARNISDETKKKMSDAAKNKSDETRRKQSGARLGKKRGPYKKRGSLPQERDVVA